MLTNHTLHIIAVGKYKSQPLKEINEQYSRNIEKFCSIRWHFVKEGGKGLPPEKKIIEEQKNISIVINQLSSPVVISLSEEFKPVTSKQLAIELQNWMTLSQKIVFVIGGAFGLSTHIKQNSHKTISLSPLTFNHRLVRVILTEQLYRCLSIIYNTSYHH